MDQRLDHGWRDCGCRGLGWKLHRERDVSARQRFLKSRRVISNPPTNRRKRQQYPPQQLSHILAGPSLGCNPFLTSFLPTYLLRVPSATYGTASVRQTSNILATHKEAGRRCVFAASKVSKPPAAGVEGVVEGGEGRMEVFGATWMEDGGM